MLLIPDLGLDMSINTENQFEYAPFDIINYFHSELLKLYDDYDSILVIMVITSKGSTVSCFNPLEKIVVSSERRF